MTKSKEEQIFIGVDDQVIELTGADKEAFLADQAQMRERTLLLKAEYKAKQDARESVITKLKALGLTESEAKIIIGIE